MRGAFQAGAPLLCIVGGNVKDYVEMFRRVIQIVRTDYVGQSASDLANKTGVLAQRLSMDILEGFGASTRFYTTTGLYLASLNDPLVTLLVDGAACDASRAGAYTRGFEIRAREGRLFVERLLGETRLCVGDEILALDSLDPAELRAKYADWIARADEQAWEWTPVVCAAHKAVVRHADGAQEELELGRFAVREELPQNSARQLDPELLEKDLDLARAVGTSPNALVVTLGRLGDAESVSALLDGRRALLDGACTLVLDLRACVGLSEECVRLLMPYVVDRPTSLSDYLASAYTRRFSKRNCDAALAELGSLHAGLACPSESLPWLDAMEQQVRANIGAGDVELVEEPEASLAVPVEARGSAQRVVVLVDRRSTGAAELLALVARDSGRAELVGRPTAGSLGFFGCVTQKIAPGYSLRYPTCRYSDEECARLCHGMGVLPETYLEWLPLRRA